MALNLSVQKAHVFFSGSDFSGFVTTLQCE